MAISSDKFNPDFPSLSGQNAAVGTEPLLIHEKSLAGKVAKGSEAGDILDQQMLWLGTQLVIQLHVLFKTSRIHGQTNAALDQPGLRDPDNAEPADQEAGGPDGWPPDRWQDAAGRGFQPNRQQERRSALVRGGINPNGG